MPPSERGMMELSNHCILAAYSGCGVDWCGTACTTSALKNARGVVNDKVLDSGGACMPLHDERGFFSLTLACSISQPHLYTVSFVCIREAHDKRRQRLRLLVHRIPGRADTGSREIIDFSSPDAPELLGDLHINKPFLPLDQYQPVCLQQNLSLHQKEVRQSVKLIKAFQHGRARKPNMGKSDSVCLSRVSNTGS